MSTYFIKAVLSCHQTVTQAHECLPTTNDSLSCPLSARMEASGAADHLQCSHSLDWLFCPLAIRVSRRLECGSYAAAAAVLAIRYVSRRLECGSHAAAAAVLAIRYVSRRLECGSHAAAAAVLAIRYVLRR